MGPIQLVGLAVMLATAPIEAVVDDPSLRDSEDAVETETLNYDRAFDDRMTVPVGIGEHGQYRFIVDTGSERTVISRQLAERLSLQPSENVLLSSVLDVQRVPTVIIPVLEIGRRTLDEIQAPALERRNLGAHGVLGIDALQGQQVTLDFKRGELTLSRSRYRNRSSSENGVIVVEARTRLGRMVLADARIDGERVYAIVDTGSSFSIGNTALRDRLVRRGRMEPDQSVVVTAVTGTSLRINYTIADRLRIGDVDLNDLPIAFTDSELFRQLGLTDRPAMLLGMNALRVFDRVSIDFGGRRLRLQIPSGGNPDRYFLAADAPSASIATSASLLSGGAQRNP